MKNFIRTENIGSSLKARGGFQVGALMLIAGLAMSFALSGCSQKAAEASKVATKDSESRGAKTISVPADVPTWFGNPARNFYGSGPWPNQPLDVIWSVKTKTISGHFHKDGWGGSGWP